MDHGAAVNTQSCISYLDIVVEDEMALPVLLQQVKSVVVREVFELHVTGQQEHRISDSGIRGRQAHRERPGKKAKTNNSWFGSCLCVTGPL